MSQRQRKDRGKVRWGTPLQALHKCLESGAVSTPVLQCMVSSGFYPQLLYLELEVHLQSPSLLYDKEQRELPSL